MTRDTILVNARDVETDNTGMTEQQLLDEVRLLLLTGRDTTTSTVTWALHLLATNPDARDALEAEVDRVIGRDRLPALEDLEHLEYARRVWFETMRLYPTATGLPRVVREPFELGGYHLKRGVELAVPVWTIQRDERFWPDPERFDPDRWHNGPNSPVHRYAYVPFGGGRRICPGQAYANQAGVLMLASVLQRWRLDMVPGTKITPISVFTLKPQEGMPMIVTERSAA